MTKEDLLSLLWQNADAYIAGEELARRLSVSRTAVWKAIGQLRETGYNIESVSNRGYRLLSESDVLSEEGIRRHLKHQELKLQVYKTITSTNTVLKSLAAEGAPAGLVLIAEEQTAGRGRMGRSFYSPADSGLYLSLLLRPNVSAVEATRLTACAAVAVAETIEELSGRPAQIKWVNDIFVDGRKVCGILTEASGRPRREHPRPDGGFPRRTKRHRRRGLRCRQYPGAALPPCGGHPRQAGGVHRKPGRAPCV